MHDVRGEGKDVGDLGIVLRRVRGWWTIQTEFVPGLEGRAEMETAFSQPPEPDMCQNHSADDPVRAQAKGPCLERKN